MRAFSVIAALLASAEVVVEGARLRFLKKTKKTSGSFTFNGKKISGKPLVTQVNAFETKEAACCACFKSKYAWPANAGLGAAFAPKQTCDTCYVMDAYGVAAKSAVVMDIPAPGADADLPSNCFDYCDHPAMPAPGCNYRHVEAGTGIVTERAERGDGACEKLIADPLFASEMTAGQMDVCDHPEVKHVCRATCQSKEHGCAAEAAYDQTKSKVMAVHEWNWNCASGNAPEDPASWFVGPVEGEPESTRGPFLMCKEDAGWYCPDDEGADTKLEAGAEKPIEVEDGSGQISVGTMTLPVIDGAQSVAASVSDF